MIMNAGGKSRSKINLMYSLSEYKIEPARPLTSLSYIPLITIKLIVYILFCMDHAH